MSDVNEGETQHDENAERDAREREQRDKRAQPLEGEQPLSVTERETERETNLHTDYTDGNTDEDDNE